MILTCPQCTTRYQTDAAHFAAEGRKVRCAKCGHTWHQAAQTPEPESTSIADLEPAPGQTQRAAYASPPAYAPSAPSLSAPEPATAILAPASPGGADWTRRLGIAVGWAALTAVILVIGWSAIRFRQDIAMLWPQSATLYAAVGKPVNTTGLAIGNVHYHNEMEDGQLVLAITGRLTNISSHGLSVPPIRVTLTDDDRRVLYNWSFSARVATLKPGQAVSFLTRLSSPPSAARHLQVQFVENGK